MLDEKALRREGFTEGIGVKLRDGQEWTFPRPAIRICGAIGLDGKPTWGVKETHGDEYEDFLDELDAAPEDATRLLLMIAMAAKLLLRNYTLADRQLGRLLAVDAGVDEAGGEMLLGIREVLLGTVPKPTADGSASPSA